VADAKISADSDAGTLAGTELIPLVTGGLNKTTTPDTLATRIAAALVSLSRSQLLLMQRISPRKS